MRILRLALAALCVAAPAVAADSEYKDGWTSKGVQEAVTACTDELVDGAWKNTKKEAGIDPDAPLTPELRKEIKPQIDAFNTLCDCVVRNSARKFGKSDYEKNTPEIDKFAVDLIEKGTCKTPPGSR